MSGDDTWTRLAREAADRMTDGELLDACRNAETSADGSPRHHAETALVKLKMRYDALVQDNIRRVLRPAVTPPGLDLDAIEARAGAATPGPWTYAKTDNDYGCGFVTEYMVGEPDAHMIPRLEDATFIMHAREDVPALVGVAREAGALAAAMVAAARRAGLYDGTAPLTWKDIAALADRMYREPAP